MERGSNSKKVRLADNHLPELMDPDAAALAASLMATSQHPTLEPPAKLFQLPDPQKLYVCCFKLLNFEGNLLHSNR